jgi:glucose-6-phosphate isomerase
MKNRPFTFELPTPHFIPSDYDNHIRRHLSAMKNMYHDQAAFEAQLAQEDTLLYEVYEIKRPEVAGEMLHGISIVHPGKIGDEYHMTKGHFHTVRATGEVYYCLKGAGVMVMETEDGQTAVEELRPGHVLYVLPNWAHRSVNTSLTDDLVTFFIYPGNAGHDYGTIEKQGFRKLIMDRGGVPTIEDNPRWQTAHG